MIAFILIVAAKFVLAAAKPHGRLSLDSGGLNDVPERRPLNPLHFHRLLRAHLGSGSSGLADAAAASEQLAARFSPARLFNKRILAVCNPPTIGCLDCVPNTVNCTNCSSEYWLSTSIMKQECILCNFTHHTRCNSCSEAVCLSCAANRTVDPANQSSCVCPVGTFWNSSSCLPCIDSCDVCSDSSTCSSCKTGYSLVGNDFCRPCT